MPGMSEFPIDLFRRNIPPEIISCVPQSVAQENLVIPLGWDDGLVVAMVDADPDTLEKLRFILNTRIQSVLATPEAIRFAIQRYYPRT
jgi:hypothetical protein